MKSSLLRLLALVLNTYFTEAVDMYWSDTTVYVVRSDSSKVQAVQATQMSSAYWVTIPGSIWIWDAVALDSQTVLFEKSFTVHNVPSSSSISISADDNYTLILNGRLVKSIPSSGYSGLTVDEVNLLAYTVVGNNILHIIGENRGQSAGVAFRITITF